MTIAGAAPQSGSTSRLRRAPAVASRLGASGAQAEIPRLGRRSIWRSALLLGFARILVVWLAAWGLYAQERNSLRAEGERDAANLAVVIERDIGHFVRDVDSALDGLLRASPDRPPALDKGLVVDGLALDLSVAEADSGAAVDDRTGLPRPDVLRGAFDGSGARPAPNADALRVWEPRRSSTSGKWVLQFARPLRGAGGARTAFLVASLDPELLAHDYAALDFGRGGGFALLGDDGGVRLGAGVLAASTGRPMPPFDATGSPGGDAASPASEAFGARRAVAGFPLVVAVAAPALDLDERLTWWRWTCSTIAALLSVLIALASAIMARSAFRFEKEIVRLARSDPLTGLANRLLIGDTLDRLFAKPAAERDRALHVVDLDRFKFVNDTYGHSAGDELLRLVAGRLVALVGRDDLVARLGGDEFAIIQKVDRFDEDAGALAGRICRELSAPYEIGGICVIVGASVGVAMAASDASAASELLKAADLALYAAKSKSGGGFALFDVAMRKAMNDRAAVENALRFAIEREELFLVYQPIKNVSAENTVGFEALLRWRRPGLPDISPGQFIPIAEESGLIVAIGAWVLERACADLARIGPGLRIAVNCSPVQLETADFAALVAECLAKSGVAADRLEIEITESFLINDTPRVAEQIGRLETMGVRISLDDFGTGYSSLNYLEHFPFDSVKIDRSFIQKLTRRAETRATVRAIVELASSFGMKTIAEGVETRAQFQAVAELGCTEAQGYLFSEPKPLDEVLLLTSLDRTIASNAA